MRYLKISLYALPLLLVGYLILCALGPTEMTVDQKITVQAPLEKVFPLVADFSKWESWSPWKKTDSTVTYISGGNPAGSVGHQVSWTSRREGNGTQEIKEIRPNEYLKIGQRFSQDPDAPVAEQQWYFSGDSTHTDVRWTLKTAQEPFLVRGLIYGMGAEGILRDYYARGLDALATVAERNQRDGK